MFKTLRVGFPDANVNVWINQASQTLLSAFDWIVSEPGYKVIASGIWRHDQWIEALLERSPEPFWIVDTDVVFFDRMPEPGDAALMGRYEPAFVEPWTGTHRVERLHTCCLYLNPDLIWQQTREWMVRWHPKGFPFQPSVEMIRQHYVPQGAGQAPLFYDTCSGLYRAIGGRAFTDEEDARFEHLHCGSYSQRINGALPGIREVHSAVFRDVNAARGLRTQQNQFYKDHAILQ